MKAPREGGESAALHGSLPEPHALLFHITTLTAWERARAAGVYTAPSMDDVGFIHLSLDRQWPGARARFFAGVSGLVLLVLRDFAVHRPSQPAEARLLYLFTYQYERPWPKQIDFSTPFWVAMPGSSWRTRSNCVRRVLMARSVVASSFSSCSL